MKVRELKQMVEDLPDDATIATLDFAERRIEPSIIICSAENVPDRIGQIINGRLSNKEKETDYYIY